MWAQIDAVADWLHRPVSASPLGCFARIFGVLLTAFALSTLPPYLMLLESTVLAFPFFPFDQLPLSPLEAPAMAKLRWLLMACGAGLATGVAARACCLTALPVAVYFMQLDRTLYNNHYVLMAQLLVFFACCCDDAALRWPRGSGQLPRWQHLLTQLLMLTPYLFGGVAKLSDDWLRRHEPIRTWAPEMLGDLDAALGGLLDRHLPAVDVVSPFAAAICWGGMLFDLGVPFALMGGAGRWAKHGVAFPASLVFNLCNKTWFGLGVFPYLMAASLVLFLPGAGAPPPTPPQKATKPAARAYAHAEGRLRRRATALSLCAYGVAHVAAPLRHVAVADASSPSWTDEGALYAWRMKLVERTGWLALRVSLTFSSPEAEAEAAAAAAAAAAARGEGGEAAWWFLPETDPALYPDQAGAVVHTPSMLRAYVRHLATALQTRGATVASVRAVSCVGVNGRPPQPLFRPEAELLHHSWAAAELLTAWRAADAPPLCSLGALHGTASEEEALRRQRASDAAYRWLYTPLARRSRLLEWPWQGRSRMPLAYEQRATGEAEATVADWLTRCSFIQAVDALWCSDEADRGGAGVEVGNDAGHLRCG